MADTTQELDPALVEKAARKITRSVYAEIVSPEVVERNVESNWQNFKSIATDTLLSLGIPAAALNALAKGEAPFDFLAHLRRQREWSERTFGPGARAAGVVDHIRKELREIEADPADLEEWIDVVILALDGAWRSGAAPEQIIAALVAKQTRNEGRVWPDWRTMSADKAIEHVRDAEIAAHKGG